MSTATNTKTAGPDGPAEPFAERPVFESVSRAAPEPPAYLGPYLGLVGAVLCALVGAFLLLAPFAFDYRQGSKTLPRATVVDLLTGGGALLVGTLTATLFGATMVMRLRAPDPRPLFTPAVRFAPEPEPIAEPFTETFAGPATEEPFTSSFSQASAQPFTQSSAEPFAERFAEPFTESFAGPVAGRPPAAAQGPWTPPPELPAPAAAEPPPPPEPDPADALRDLLTPLVAALAADLRARADGSADEKD